eukprot:276612-Prorocentrum_minimum.AAC.7
MTTGLPPFLPKSALLRSCPPSPHIDVRTPWFTLYRRCGHVPQIRWSRVALTAVGTPEPVELIKVPATPVEGYISYTRPILKADHGGVSRRRPHPRPLTLDTDYTVELVIKTLLLTIKPSHHSKIQFSGTDSLRTQHVRVEP